MVVIVFTVGAAVKPAANSLPEDTKEPEPTQPTTEAVQQEPYPFNLMSLDWSGEEVLPGMYAAIHIHNLQAERR